MSKRARTGLNKTFGDRRWYRHYDEQKSYKWGREMALWLTFSSFKKQAWFRRTTFAASFHECQGFVRERYHVVRNMHKISKSQKRAKESPEDREQRLQQIWDDEYDYMNQLELTARMAAESLIYGLDSLAQSCAHEINLNQKFWVGGRPLTEKISLLEGLRATANWQRHHYTESWREYNASNWSHQILKDLGLWHTGSSLPQNFITSLGYDAYTEFEADYVEAVGYMIREMGITHSPDYEPEKWKDIDPASMFR